MQAYCVECIKTYWDFIYSFYSASCPWISNAVKCNAVNHCYQTVWEKKAYPVDNDSVCQICKDMVGQARDQLRSNETEEELEEVLEGNSNIYNQSHWLFFIIKIIVILFNTFISFDAI